MVDHNGSVFEQGIMRDAPDHAEVGLIGRCIEINPAFLDDQLTVRGPVAQKSLHDLLAIFESDASECDHGNLFSLTEIGYLL
ncbi:MAG: hypothetical protein BWY82_02130 [Verrucomicrobia bacterium ADurb.Bin474]|nr:MAG: hypothetical protein BWY82_02130 [Verrucomicrobia bacterium ADurb.Bin474]